MNFMSCPKFCKVVLEWLLKWLHRTIVGPSVCGAVAAAMGYVPAMWLVMTIPILFAAGFTLLARKKLQKIEAEFQKRTMES